MKKRIVVLNIAASKTGALSVLRDFYAYVLSDHRDAEWFFIVGAEGLLEDPGEGSNIHVVVRSDVKRSKVNRLLFDRFSAASFLAGFKPDVVFSMQNTLPEGVERLKRAAPEKDSTLGGASGEENGGTKDSASRREGGSSDGGAGKVKSVIYLHQPLGFQKIRRFSFFHKYERELFIYQYLISRSIDASLKRADRVIVQTRWMKDGVCDKDGLEPDKVRIVSPDVPELRKLCKPNLVRDNSCFFYPAGHILYKDHQCVVDAAEILCNRGVEDFRVIFTEKREDLPWIRVPSSVQGKIDFRGSVSRNGVVELYQQTVLLFPSYIETFGYPLAEARQLGVPVIAADTPFAREILDGSGRKTFFSPSDAKGLAALMEESILRGWGDEGSYVSTGDPGEDSEGKADAKVRREGLPGQKDAGEAGTDAGERRSSWGDVVDILMEG